MLSNDYFLLAGEWYATIGGLCTLHEGTERMITPLPLTHMNAMAYSAMAMVMTGGCLVQLDRFHPGSWWDSVRESRATVVHYLGVMPAMLLGAPPSPQDREHARALRLRRGRRPAPAGGVRSSASASRCSKPGP